MSTYEHVCCYCSITALGTKVFGWDWLRVVGPGEGGIYKILRPHCSNLLIRPCVQTNKETCNTLITNSVRYKIRSTVITYIKLSCVLCAPFFGAPHHICATATQRRRPQAAPQRVVLTPCFLMALSRSRKRHIMLLPSGCYTTYSSTYLLFLFLGK